MVRGPTRSSESGVPPQNRAKRHVLRREATASARTSGDGQRGFSDGLIRSALIRHTSNRNVYISARKSMTIRCYVHSVAKRAEITALVDSGATENFMNLTYAKWLRLPIKRLDDPRPLYNVDNSENKSGALRFYTDLQVRTGQENVTLRFFLSDLGDHKAILGYPWFAATQPRIDCKRGWIDHTQLHVILKASDSKRAKFVP